MDVKSVHPEVTEPLSQFQGSPSRKQIKLSGGPPWGFRMCGGRDTNILLKIARVNPGSKAARSGVREGDLVTAINGECLGHLTNGEVQRIIKKSGPSMTLELTSAKRMNAFEGSASAAGELESEGASSVVTKKPSTTETGPSSSTSATTDTSKATTSVTTTAGGAVAASVPLTEQTPGKSVNSIGQSEEVRGSGKKKKSPSHSGSGKSGKSSSKKKSVEFINERSVDEPVKKSIQEENHGYDYPDKDSKGCTCGVGGGYNDGNLNIGWSQNQKPRGDRDNANSASRNGTMVTGDSTNNRSSLLGEIIAELDDLLGTSYFSHPNTLATNKNPTFRSHNNTGVWTPGITNNSQGSSSASQQPLLVIKQQESHSSKRRGSKDQVAPDSDTRELPDLEEPPPPVWTPPNAPSPSTQKKFRPVNFNVPGSPVSSTPHTVSLERSVSAGQVAERKVSFGAGDVHSVPSTQPQRQGQRKPEISGDLSRVEGGGSIHQNHNLHQSQSSPSVNLPKYQSPTVTLLQKAREGHLPKGALYLDHKIPGVQRSSSASGGFNSLLPQQHPVAGPSSSSQQPSSLNPNDTLYELKREDYRSTPTGATSRRADFTPKKYDGVGPTTPDGVPIALKSGINNGHEWYRRMYESLHVDNKPQRKGAPLRSPYGGPASGSWSEPEGYESDTYAYKYATLDRRKLRDRYASDTEYLSPGPSTPTSIPGSIRFVPGRIEDYTPGNSSVAAKEIRRHKPTLQWALGSKDLGYESDSNLVIKKRQESQEIPPPPPLSPAEQRQVYVEIQKGGEVPLHGLRKPAPEKPKEIESPMPTLDDVRRSLSSRPRSGSPSSFRSGSPSIIKSHSTTVSLLQERIQSKLRRANSDINPAQVHGRSRSGSSNAAARLIHSVRSMSQVRHVGSASSIPIRSRNPSMEKLRVSSPELQSPREVKKAMETSHRLAIKLEVVKTVPSSSNGSKKPKSSSSDGNAGEKKSGLKKSGTSKNGKTKIKSVKIAESGGSSAVNSTSTSTSTTSASSTSTVVPAKPPRKLNGKSQGNETIGKGGESRGVGDIMVAANGSLQGASSIHKTIKATPVAARHAGCLSPHHSRPTSPGSNPIPLPSTVKSSVIPVPPKIPQTVISQLEKSLSSIHAQHSQPTIKAERRKSCAPVITSNTTTTTVLATTTGPSPLVASSFFPAATLTTVATKGSNGSSGQPGSRSSRATGESMGSEKEIREKRTSKSTSSKVSCSAVATSSTAATQNDVTIKGKSGKGEGEDRRAIKRARDETDGHLKCVKSKSEKENPARLGVTSSLTQSSALPVPCEPAATTFPLSLPSASASPYLTMPVRGGKDYLMDVWTLEAEHDMHRRSCSPSFRSLPALTPYLKETKRVSGSAFVTKTNHAAMLREKVALAKRLGLDDPTAPGNFLKIKGKKQKKSGTGSGGGDVGKQSSGGSKGVNSTRSGGKNAHAVVRSASCLGLRRSKDYTYARYILELQHSRKKSPRFLQLHRLYSSLERLGELERSTSMYDIPILSLERQLDFDAWWKVRHRSRVDEEIASISSQLSTAQKNRECFFRPRKLEDFRWRGDSALRTKRWSIDELRSFLMGEYDERLHCKSANDLHKTAWRGTSVKEVALNMEVSALSKGDRALSESQRFYGGPWLRRAFSMSSTLSEDQRENIKARLGSLIRQEKVGGKERIGRPMERRVITSRMGMTTSSDPSSSVLYRTDSGRIIGADGCLTEAAKKQLSRSLSHEFREKKNLEKKKKSSESESAKSDDSIRTVIHVPISTKLLLSKMDKEKDKDKSKVPAFSVYCKKGVPSKVTFFENYYQRPEGNSSGKQFFTFPGVSRGRHPAKVVGNSSRNSSVGRSASPTGKTQQRIPSLSPAKSPTGGARRSRSVSPTPSVKAALSYMSHVNVISRLASLLLKKDDALKSLVTREIMERERLERLRLSNAGEVDRLRHYYEAQYPEDDDDEYGKLAEINLLRCLFCSDPNLARMTEWRSDHCSRRCASADIFKDKLELSKQQQQSLDRKPDGRESSPVNCSSPDLYLNSRSRKPIYQPSSTPNVCQPTLTAHCFLESPNKSLEYLNQQQLVQQPASSSCYSSDYSGGIWDFYSATESVGTASPSPPYHSISIPPPPRMLDSRISNGSTGTGVTSTRNWNVDPALHQPKFRYVPPQPRGNMHSMPPPIPPPPALPKLPMSQQDLNAMSLSGGNIENRPYNPYLYRSVRYWNPRTRTREYEGVIGPIPPNRNSHQASQNGILSPPPPPSASSSQTLMSNNAVRNNRFLRQGGGYDEDDGKQSENQSTLVESQFRRQAQLNNNVSSEPESSAASPLLPAPVKYAESEVNIHYKAPVRLVEKDYIGEEELRRRQQIVMRRFYEEQRHRKFLAEIQDMENRRHTDNFTPSQKSPIPLNRYEDMIDEPQRPRWREKTPDQKIVAKALFNFVPQNSRELSFRKGDILFIRRKLDANWFEGEHNAAVGIFPSSYVEIIPSYEIDRATPRIPSEGQARVRFNFTAASPVEMSIIKGETVVLTRRVDVNWYEGRIGSRRGIFPVSYVQVLKEPGSDLTASLSPKPVGSPAAHSLATHHNQNFRHNYKPNDYAINSEFTSLHSSPPASIPNYSSRGNYGGGRLSQSGAQQQGHSSYSQNLTIDTRIEPLSYKAIYNYRPAHEDELELQENDIVHVLEKCDDGWFVGTSTRTGLFGTFPGNYVERVF